MTSPGECTVTNCQCAFHRTELPTPELRWYCVTVGRDPGVYQGHDYVEKLTSYVSGATFNFFTTEHAARQEFERAIHAREVVKVIPSVRLVLTREDLAEVPGFRCGDPLGPESGDWAVVIVGRTPGIFLSLPGSPALRMNLVHVKRAQALYMKSRSAAVHEFLKNLDNGSVVRVASDEQRVFLDDSVL